MKKIIYTGLLTHGLFSWSAPDPDLEALKKLNEKFIHNFVTNDTASHSRIIHRDFIHVSSTGKYTARKEYLEKWAHGFEGYKYWDYRDEDIRIFGNTALIHSQNKYIFVQDGKEVTGWSMYTDTYIKENGEWKCIQAQISKVAPENYAADETIVKKYDFRSGQK
jgi:hypothetical protein